MRELQSIVDYGEVGPSIDPSCPGETASSRYWSATSFVFFPSVAWNVNFNNGNVNGNDLAFLNQVRAVRGGP